MNKEEIIKSIEKYKLNKSRFVVIAGAAMVFHGIKTIAKDIDISCDEEYCDFLLNSYDCKYERTNELGNPAYFIDNIFNFGVSFMPKEIDIIDGIQVASIKDIYKLKKMLNRNKDKEDIKYLQKIINNSKI